MLSRYALAAFLTSVFTACASPEGGDPLPFVPADADNVLIVPSVAELQKNAASFLAGIEGTSGLLELAADRFGLDLRTPEGPTSLGLDPTRGLVLYTLRSAAPQNAANPGSPAPESPGSDTQGSPDATHVVAVFSVASPDTFRDNLALRLTRSVGLTAGPEADIRVFKGQAGLSVALGLVESADGPLGLLVIARGHVDAASLWRTAAARPATPFVGSARDRAASDTGALRFAWRFEPPAAPDGLGLLRGLVDNVAERLSSWEGSLSLSAERLSLQMATAKVKDTADATPLPVVWVNPPDPKPSRLAQVFPRTTTATLRFRVNLDKVRSVPSFIRNNVVPDQLPGLESFPLPATSDLIELLDGDLAVAFLGLAPNTRLPDLSTRALRRLPELTRVAFAAGLRDGAAFRRTYTAIAEQFGTSGWTVASLTPSDKTGWSGWTFAKEGQHFTLLHDDQVAVFLVGDGELEAFVATREARALPLSSFAEASPGATRALGLDPKPGFLGLLISPVRLTKELAARSVPPYFLKIINDVRLFAGDLGATADGVDLRLELGL